MVIFKRSLRVQAPIPCYNTVFWHAQSTQDHVPTLRWTRDMISDDLDFFRDQPEERTLVDVRASYTTRIRAASRIRGSYFQSSYEARTAKLVYEARMAKARMVDLGTRLVPEYFLGARD